MGITKKILLSSLIIALLYLLFVVFVMNSSLLETTLFGPFPLNFKLKLFLALLQGLTTTMTTTSLILLVINACLTGITLSLTFRKIFLLKQMGNVHVVTGGSALLGIVSGGCVSCGLPLLSLLGLSGSLLYLPFKGAELPILSIVLLSLSLFLLLRSQKKEDYCEIPRNKNK